jgi:hypothetical protein
MTRDQAKKWLEVREGRILDTTTIRWAFGFEVAHKHLATVRQFADGARLYWDGKEITDPCVGYVGEEDGNALFKAMQRLKERD